MHGIQVQAVSGNPVDRLVDGFQCCGGTEPIVIVAAIGGHIDIAVNFLMMGVLDIEVDFEVVHSRTQTKVCGIVITWLRNRESLKWDIQVASGIMDVNILPRTCAVVVDGTAVDGIKADVSLMAGRFTGVEATTLMECIIIEYIYS